MESLKHGYYEVNDIKNHHILVQNHLRVHLPGTSHYRAENSEGTKQGLAQSQAGSPRAAGPKFSAPEFILLLTTMGFQPCLHTDITEGAAKNTEACTQPRSWFHSPELWIVKDCQVIIRNLHVWDLVRQKTFIPKNSGPTFYYFLNQ